VWARLLLAVAMAGFLSVVGLAGQAQEAAPQRPAQAAPIKLKGATFVPTLGEKPQVPAELSIAGYAPDVRGYYIVQFAGPIADDMRAEVEALGAELLGYVPELAFKVRMTPAQAAAVKRLGRVAWVGLFHPAFKLSPDLKRDGRHWYKVKIETGADPDLVRADVLFAGAEVVSASGNVMVIAADSPELDAVAHILDVAWIENFVFYEKHNEYGAGVILNASAANAAGYDGSGEIIAIADSGLGGGTTTTGHPDIPSTRIAAIHSWTASPPSVSGCYTTYDNGAKDEDSGHGTHVAVSALGDGGTGGIARGTAPAARLLFQAVEEYVDFTTFCNNFFGVPDGYYLFGIPDDLRQLFQQAYDGGARVHSDSWGTFFFGYGVYTGDSADTDDFVWSHRDMAITFSAGNGGIDGNGDGVIDADSMAAPATAKNVIAVGASENDRFLDYACDANLNYLSDDATQTCAAQGGQNHVFAYGEAWPQSFPFDPLFSDPSAGDAEQMAAFSSRGPTDDGRIKPDVVAPGTWVLSGYSNQHRQGYGGTLNRLGQYQWDGWGYPRNSLYKYMGGTSMANPLTAGAAAVVRDFYMSTHTHSASAALVKATLINSAVDLLDENNDGVADNAFPIPNIHEGWGRVDVGNATDGSHRYVDNATGLGTGEVATSNFNVVVAGAPFKATLVWSDFRAEPSALATLVNDLDLVVMAPGGTIYRGNVFAGGWSQAGGLPDRTNNVENVYVQSAAAGSWTVIVNGFNVPFGPQPFALVVDVPNFAPTANADNYSTSEDTPLTVGAPGVLGNDSDADGDPLTAVLATDPANGSLTLNPDGGFIYTPNPGFGGVDGFTYRANDGTANSNTASVTITVDATSLIHVGDLDRLSGTDASGWWAQVTVRVHSATHGAVAGAVVTGTWSGGATGTAQCTTNTYGDCTVKKSGIPTAELSVTFTVDNLAKSGRFYSSGANHDPDGDSTGTAITIGSPLLIHVGDLDRLTGVDASGWWAQVTVRVHSATHGAVAGAVVTGTWSGGATGTAQCTTNIYGYCNVKKPGIPTSELSVTFTVDNVTKLGRVYSAIANHDPDGDSTGTVTTISSPLLIHVGDLDRQRGTDASGWWAQVTVRVHSTTHGAVAGAVVTGTWSGGATGTAQCTTNTYGYCNVKKSAIPISEPSVTFTVNDVDKAGRLYSSSANHDPERDSNGTVIAIGSPLLIHVGDLDRQRGIETAGWWAQVTVRVHSATHGAVAGAVVTGTWSGGATGTSQCTTNAYGYCSVKKSAIPTSAPSVAFTVDNLAKSGLLYAAAANHDPDADSNGTAISVAKP
jgi:hypothetical protein